MDYREFFLGQLEREMALNRKVLTQVPEGSSEFKPHERSMVMGYLTALVAQMPAWIAMMLTTDELNLDDKEQSGKFQTKPIADAKELLPFAEESYEKAKAALNEAKPETFDGMWSFTMGGKKLSSGPRYQQIADTFTHMAHHRGQLTVYLRLVGAKVPGTYGPSGDDLRGGH